MHSEQTSYDLEIHHTEVTIGKIQDLTPTVFSAGSIGSRGTGQPVQGIVAINLIRSTRFKT